MKNILLFLFIFYNININCTLIEMPNGEEYDYDSESEYQVELTGGDAGCHQYHITGATSEPMCTQYELSDPNLRCCYVFMKKDSYYNGFCLPIAYNPLAIGDVKKSFHNSNELEILCYINKLENILFIYFIFFIILL
jgi:hypothetical protein